MIGSQNLSAAVNVVCASGVRITTTPMKWLLLPGIQDTSDITRQLFNKLSSSTPCHHIATFIWIIHSRVVQSYDDTTQASQTVSNTWQQ